MDAHKIPAAARRRFHRADGRFAENDRPELRPHAPGGVPNGPDGLVPVHARRKLDVRIRKHPAVWKPADVGDGAVGNEHHLVEQIAEGGEAQADLFHAADDHHGAGDFHQIAHVHRV